jgi:long-chain acyl-CoA synthetase
MAHMYGLSCEFLLEFCNGNHIFFLTRTPSPTLIEEAFSEIHPAIIISVPLIIEKIVRKSIFPLIQTNRVKLLMNTPVINKKVKQRICEMVKNIFGGNAYEMIIGGAPMNHEIEKFFHEIGFPITMGYGTTETAPMITYSDWHNYIPGSCGTPFYNMEVKILSTNPQNIPGEIITRGPNTMQGYYKNMDATKAVLDEEGWFHTGDLATMSEDGHIFICGRIKNMILGANGQNIYPEEIENKLNSMAMVSESIIIQKNEKLIGLVHPDLEEVQSLGFSNEDLINIMEQNRKQLNNSLPTFCKVNCIKICDTEFEKTPKKSIKRYLYQDAV